MNRAIKQVVWRWRWICGSIISSFQKKNKEMLCKLNNDVFNIFCFFCLWETEVGQGFFLWFIPAYWMTHVWFWISDYDLKKYIFVLVSDLLLQAVPYCWTPKKNNACPANHQMLVRWLKVLELLVQKRVSTLWCNLTLAW